MTKTGLAAITLVAVSFVACGKKDDGGGGKVSAKVSMASGASATALTDVGDSGASGLQSLKYAIQSIQICKEMTPSGTGFSGTSGCIELYNGGTDSNMSAGSSTSLSSLDYAAMMTYAKAHDDKFVDLVTAAGRAKLAGSATMKKGDSGSYKWGLVNWHYPIKVKGTAVSSGVTYATKDGTYSNWSGLGSSGKNDAGGALAGSTAAEAVVSLPNGGSWFAFPTPFEVDETQEYSIDLVFNPDGLLKVNHPAASNYPQLVGTDVSMSIPFINLTPVPHKAGQAVTRESYLAPYSSGGVVFDTRLDLYFVEGSETIYGVDTRNVAHGTTATTDIPDMQKISFVTKEANGTYTFKDYAGNALISGFTRGASTGATFFTCAVFNGVPCGTTATFTRQ